ncbi:ATP-dependent zinc metalloprotease YME1L-like [Homarus americanus]|uniref:ATP-dependent zinc metalloprotease YME1-like n=1 Tax=Homarus americanus TaxID=6706 RepID=A0A8J5MRD2_HOMAM|nr:ATP-dependent zinc metalloprotease YME1L-like [Homarus americanus]KAG7160789.1 ATP-dependent zinc metalloprotease YME1-like [Homarus americanus]
MFSTSSSFLHNQVVLPLSYIVSQYPGVRRGHNKANASKQNGNHAPNTVDIMCSDHLAETVQLLGESGLEEVSKLVTPQLLHHLALHGPKVNLPCVVDLTKECLQSSHLLDRKQRWHVSHKSANTFLENKHMGSIAPSFSGDVRLQPLFNITKKLLSSHTLSPNVVQYCGFKTQQSIEREALRQSSVTNRLRDGLKSRQRSVTNRTLQQETEHNTKLKGLMSEEATEGGRKSLKVAFAEGYLAADPQKQQSRAMRWIRNFQQVLAVVVFIAILISLMGGMGGSVFRMHVGNGNEVHPEEITVSFEDVKGVEEAKQELQEIVEFLRNPEKFTSLGAELPKGVLLVGPPGTGKTLLARAVAGEAGVPFFHAAGPEFDEILVGQGARRVRDLFRAAKIRAPCVIFIDEIDSVGAKRSNSVLHPYANQTINQLLAEMDGFHKNEGVIVLGATNRRDDLDRALLRPGRFDVEVQVPVPDLAGRKEIFEYYLGKVKVGHDVDKNVLSRGTTGFTGADIKNVTNQAALRAAADQVDSVSMKHLEAARDKVLMGPERKSRIPDEEANLVTSYHEGGHTLVAFYTKDSHPLHKVTIIPRGPSLGHTAYIPAKEQYHMTRSQMLATMDSLMGGRAAEELIFGNDLVTSGSSSDLKQATNIATHMVKDLGMSERVGLRTFEDNSSQLISTGDSLGQSTKECIDTEIKRLLQESYERAKAILKSHAREHKALADALMKYETLDADDIKAILDGKPVAKEL